jgi:hypothetical protein
MQDVQSIHANECSVDELLGTVRSVHVFRCFVLKYIEEWHFVLQILGLQTCSHLIIWSLMFRIEKPTPLNTDVFVTVASDVHLLKTYTGYESWSSQSGADEDPRLIGRCTMSTGKSLPMRATSIVLHWQTLKMDAACFSEISVIVCQWTSCSISGALHLNMSVSGKLTTQRKRISSWVFLKCP